MSQVANAFGVMLFEALPHTVSSTACVVDIGCEDAQATMPCGHYPQTIGKL